MGCDIHGVVQAKYRDIGWESVLEIDRDRNYQLFTALAGVRAYDDNPKVIAEPRGLPSDFKVNGDEHELDYGYMIWMGDHSHSWLTLDEIESWSGWDDTTKANVGEAWFAWLRYLRLRYGDMRQVRIVFGFDN